MAETFDAVIIGTGQSGPSPTARMTREGMKTAVIERKLFGGTCVNVGGRAFVPDMPGIVDHKPLK